MEAPSAPRVLLPVCSCCDSSSGSSTSTSGVRAGVGVEVTAGGANTFVWSRCRQQMTPQQSQSQQDHESIDSTTTRMSPSKVELSQNGYV